MDFGAFLAYWQREPTTLEVVSRYILVFGAGSIGAILFCPPIVALCLSWGAIYGTRFPPPSLNSTDSHSASKYILLYSPNHLSRIYIVKIVLTVVYKTLTLRYLAQRLLRRSRNLRGEGVAIPGLQLNSTFTITHADIELFAGSLQDSSPSRIAGPTDFDTLQRTAQNPLLVPALTTPLLILTLTHPSVQLNPLGAVNVRNRFEIVRPARLQSLLEPLYPEAKTQPNFLRLQVDSHVGGPQRSGRLVKRGMEFDVRIEVSEPAQHQEVKSFDQSEEDNNGNLLMVQELTFLQFLPQGSGPSAKPDTATDAVESTRQKELRDIRSRVAATEMTPTKARTPKDIAKGETSDERQASKGDSEIRSSIRPDEEAGDTAGIRMNLTPQDPRLWARMTKDYNPIHVSPLLAHLFGFKNVIAHGNHVAARVFATTVLDRYKQPYTVELQFRRPVVLPETAAIETQEFEEEGRRGSRFRILDMARKKEYITGHVERL